MTQGYSCVTDAALIDAALEAFLARRRAGEVDASYAAYDMPPIDEPDEWGDLASFRQAAAASLVHCRHEASPGGASRPKSAGASGRAVT